MQVFKVEGMSCQHCVAAITRSLQALDGGAQVQVELADGLVRLTSQLSAEQVVQALADEGYTAQRQQD